MFDAPFYYMPIPLDEDGSGPCEPEDAVRTSHEVWDSTCSTVCYCNNEETALWVAVRLNGIESGAASDDGQPDEAQEWQDYDPDC